MAVHQQKNTATRSKIPNEPGAEKSEPQQNANVGVQHQEKEPEKVDNLASEILKQKLAEAQTPAYKNQILAQFTSAQQKEIAKQNQENKVTKKYCLSVLRDGIYQEVTDEEFLDFQRQCPEVAEILEDNSLLHQIPLPKLPDTNTPLYDCWDKAAKRLINSLWRCSSAQIFHNPVDPDRLGIPDYFEVVKEPIDLGTIK